MNTNRKTRKTKTKTKTKSRNKTRIRNAARRAKKVMRGGGYSYINPQIEPSISLLPSILSFKINNLLFRTATL